MTSHHALPYRRPFSPLRLTLSDLQYKLTRLSGAPGRPQVIGRENLPPAPAIYVANHAGPDGPMFIVRALPVRLHPWSIRAMLQHRTAPRYFYEDVGHPVWGLNGRWGMIVCTLIGHLSVLFLKSLCVISVHKEEGLFDPCFEASLALLTQGRNLLIFPEDPFAEGAPISQVRHFGNGFGWLGARYVREVGGQLPLTPLVVHPPSNSVKVLPSIMISPEMVSRARDTRQLCQQVQQLIHEAYCELEQGPATPLDRAA